MIAPCASEHPKTFVNLFSLLQRHPAPLNVDAPPFTAPQQAADVFVDASSDAAYSTASDTSKVRKISGVEDTPIICTLGSAQSRAGPCPWTPSLGACWACMHLAPVQTLSTPKASKGRGCLCRHTFPTPSLLFVGIH